MAGAGACVFCEIARSSTSTQLLYSDEKVVAFQDINPSAFWHYLVISVEHISTVKDLRSRMEDYKFVSHMLDVGQTLLRRDAPDSKQYRGRGKSWWWRCSTGDGFGWQHPVTGDSLHKQFGFHQPPLYSVNHLHLHCLALPFIPGWKHIKYTSLGPFGGFIEAEKLLKKIKP